MIPGSNLLNLAFTVIAQQQVTYLKAISRAPNNVGQYVVIYDTPVVLNCSFQPIPRKLVVQYGLDLQKDYFTLYASKDMIDVSRDTSGDRIVFNNRVFQCESDNDWYKIDGWKGIICVDVGPSSEFKPVFGYSSTEVDSGNENYEHGGFAE